MSESWKKNVFRAFGFQICQSIKEIVLDAFGASKRMTFSALRQKRDGAETLRGRTSEEPGGTNPVPGSAVESGAPLRPQKAWGCGRYREGAI